MRSLETGTNHGIQAVKDQLIGANPVSALTFFPATKATRYLPNEEIARLQAVLAPDAWDLVGLGQ